MKQNITISGLFNALDLKCDRIEFFKTLGIQEI